MTSIGSFRGIRSSLAAIATGSMLLLGCQERSPEQASSERSGFNQKATDADVTPRPAPERPQGFTKLSDEWFVDGDGNKVPDFIERQLDYDPAKDDCPITNACGEGATGSERAFRLSNTLVILDSSGSMAAKLGGAPKIQLAKRSLNDFIIGMHERSRLGFMVYGHKGNNKPEGKAESCRGIELLAPIGSISRGDATNLLNRFEPRGWTPIAASLQAARNAFPAQGEHKNRIILVSDGIETCEGDPVAIARQLRNEGLNVEVDVIGFDVGAADAAALEKIADAGGGKYVNARTYTELDEYFRQQRAAMNKSAEAGRCEFNQQYTTWECDTKFERAASEAIRAAASKLDQQARVEAWALRSNASAAIRQQSLAKRQSALQRQEQRYDEFFDINKQDINTLQRQRKARLEADARATDAQ